MNLFKFADIRRGKDSSDRVGQFMLGSYIILFLLFLVLPLGALISKSLENKDGEFIGFANYSLYLQEPALFQSLYNSLFVAIISTIIVVVLAFLFAYAITRTCMPFKGFFKLVALIPLLSPSILAAIALVYWFGNQGVLKEMLLGKSIYGPIGIIMASVYWTFPHALIILTTSLSLSDSRLYEAAEVLKTSKLRAFFTITIPGARYGIISTAFVIFTQVFTDFGVPKVIGGNYNVLATDIYKEVVGMQNFQMGAVISMVLLVPAMIAFFIDRYSRKKQISLLTSRSVVFKPKKHFKVDMIMLSFCSVLALIIILMIGMAQYGAIVKFWPYNLNLTLKNYNFEVAGLGWDSFYNSVQLAFYTAIFGTIIIFVGSYLIEKLRINEGTRNIVQFFALMPMAVPGLVLGLAYIFFFNAKDNPLNFIYATMIILVVNTIVHFYTVSHLTTITALKQMDKEFESVSLSLKIPIYKMFWRVTLPVCLPPIFDVSIYLFVNAMTTVSGVIFLYSYDTTLASVSAIHLDEQGEVAKAAAMAMLIVYVSVAVRLTHTIITKKVLRKTQAWRYNILDTK
ncbi:MAG: putative 2-aminoethylphosphonate ABC transporter permease subunit [Pelagibacteraceae bacterium]|jgi:iron(III) transport system permease protein|nr:putative 2-aminoethylphosphonate ABC transporter permease subunit [Pelagibacteraceae bacterium]MBT3903153.1 putative 2-aminoethylphosphonate ABC transporter permease subunit [Pelagibacteraceae bacterium]MBT4646530.1 putative 2-aminoethylphosphonate ABC transporter permease subunit [Pelagibacteraceae bacterium]MBT4950731.1 putative 2-aminoethylphosphonate ABC transporter permease subunit [Pelagibacteraceae bacterium]MBT5213920.1 putative 2-aminoethylphosphonate ABC transporter permease subuni